MPMRETFKSQSFTWAAGSTIVVPLNFLEQAAKFRSPVIDHFSIRFVATNVQTTGNASFATKHIPAFFSKIQLTDAAGDRVNVSGRELRMINQIELGDSTFDYPNVVDGGTFDYLLRMPFGLQKCRRRADTRIPVQELQPGGTLLLYCAAAVPTGVDTIATSLIEVFAEVVEERSRELKSRLCYIGYNMPSTEYQYPVSGSLRWAMAYKGDTAYLAGSPWSANNITSRTLNLQSVPQTLLLDRYVHESRPRVGSAASMTGGTGSTDDEVVNAYLIPACVPRFDQKIPELPDVNSLHYKTDAASVASDARMLIASITDRSESLSMRTLGAASSSQASQAIAQHGFVKQANGNKAKVGRWSPTASRRLPVKLRRPKP